MSSVCSSSLTHKLLLVSQTPHVSSFLPQFLHNTNYSFLPVPQVLINKFFLSLMYSSISGSLSQCLHLSSLSSHNALSHKRSLLTLACCSPLEFSSTVPNPALDLSSVAPTGICLPRQLLFLPLLFFSILVTHLVPNFSLDTYFSEAITEFLFSIQPSFYKVNQDVHHSSISGRRKGYN